MRPFSPADYPAAGVGVGFNNDIVLDDAGVTSLPRTRHTGFDYIEVQPSHFILFPDLSRLAGSMPMLVHCSQFSLATPGIPMDREYLALTRRIARETNSPWFAEHISWTRFKEGDTRHFFLPWLDDGLVPVIAGNARSLRETIGIPLLLENCPRTFSLDLGGPRETDFIRRVIEESGAGFLLDISSAVRTARRLNYDLWEYVNALPLERLIEVHVGDPVSEWDLLEHLLRNSPVKAVTLEANMGGLTPGEQAGVASRIRSYMREPCRSWILEPGAGRSAAARPDAASAGRLEFGAGRAPLKVDEAARFRFRDGRLVIEQPRRGIVKELPLAALPIIARFMDWTPVSAAFSAASQDLTLAFAVVRDLVASGVLAVDGEAARRGGDPDIGWADWDGALQYHLASRTTASTAYMTADESAARLIERAKDQPPPQPFKDYSVHPFVPFEGTDLPQGADPGFLDVVLRRRVCRDFSLAPVSKEQLSVLLYLTWGCTGSRPHKLGPHPWLMKTSPSGGSLHSVEVYPILLNVEGVPSGIYHYSVRRHGLEMLSREDPREWLLEAVGNQNWVGDCSAVFVMTSALERMMWKYRESRAYRVLLFDIGHLSQTFLLAATWLKLGSFVTAAFKDEIFEQKLGLSYLEEPVFLLTGVGKPR